MLQTENYKILLSVDPGLATGICIIDISDMNDPKPLEACELSVNEFYDKLDEIFTVYGKYMEMVVENFIITTRTAKLTQAPWSLQLIGVCMYLARKHNVDMTLQSPSRKEFATNDKLRKVGFWAKGTEGHSIDAYRHAMVWIIDRYPKFAKKLLV